jgi:phage protein U
MAVALLFDERTIAIVSMFVLVGARKESTSFKPVNVPRVITVALKRFDDDEATQQERGNLAR